MKLHPWQKQIYDWLEQGKRVRMVACLPYRSGLKAVRECQFIYDEIHKNDRDSSTERFAEKH